MKFFTYILFFIFIYGCAVQEVNTIKYKFRTEDIVKKECRKDFINLKKNWHNPR